MELTHNAITIQKETGFKEDKNQPRCNGEVALADAVVTLASNVAMREKKRIEFKDEWFDVKSDAAPDA